MLPRKSQISAALVWAMIPLTLFASLPRTGCICANGQHKFFCQRHLTANGNGRCCCCYGNPATKSQIADRAKSAPSGQMSCCRRARSQPTSDLPSAHSEPGCRPVLDKPLFLTVLKASLDLDRADSMPLFLAFEPVPVLSTSIVADIHRGELLPPPDLVVTLRILLI